jgi:hypothetical protein
MSKWPGMAFAGDQISISWNRRIHAYTKADQRSIRYLGGPLMFIRRRRAAISFIASAFLAVGLLGGFMAATAAPASASPTITLCLANDSQFCADVKDGTNKSGEPVWLYNKNQGASDYHFVELADPNCVEGGCDQFEVGNTGLCLEAPTGVGGDITLGGCNDGRGAWYGGSCNTGHLSSAFYGVKMELTVNAPANEKYLYGYGCVQPGGSVYQNWSGW